MQTKMIFRDVLIKCSVPAVFMALVIYFTSPFIENRLVFNVVIILFYASFIGLIYYAYKYITTEAAYCKSVIKILNERIDKLADVVRKNSISLGSESLLNDALNFSVVLTDNIKDCVTLKGLIAVRDNISRLSFMLDAFDGQIDEKMKSVHRADMLIPIYFSQVQEKIEQYQLDIESPGYQNKRTHDFEITEALFKEAQYLMNSDIYESSKIEVLEILTKALSSAEKLRVFGGMMD